AAGRRAPPPLGRSARAARAWPRPRGPSGPGAQWGGRRPAQPAPASPRRRSPPPGPGPPGARARRLSGRRAASRPRAGRARAVSPADGPHDEQRVLAPEAVADVAAGERIGDPALAVHDEHVLVGAGGE